MMGMNPQMMMMMNMMGGMQGMNMGGNNMGMGNMGNNMQMGNNMGMNMGMGNMMMPNFGNDDWMKGLEMAMNEDNGQQENEGFGPKINVAFTTTQGTKTVMIYKHGTTVGNAFELYLKRVGRPDLINNLQGRLCFIFNAKQVKFAETTKIEDFFKNYAAPKIIVNDVNNLIGA